MEKQDDLFLSEAAQLAIEGVMNDKGGPFGAVIVKDGLVIGKGCNTVTSTNDPTAHAEIEAIRAACKHLSTYDLKGAIIYSSCEPCPMCLSAIYWARLEKIFFATTQQIAADYGFDDSYIYKQVPLPSNERNIKGVFIYNARAEKAFEIWNLKEDKRLY